MIHVLRRVGIAIGSLVAAWLAVHLMVGLLLGPTAAGNTLVSLFALVLGGLVYQDIIRREPRTA